MDDRNITPMFVLKCSSFLSLQTDVIVESKHINICNAWNRFAFPSQNMSKRHPTQETPIHVHPYETNEKGDNFISKTCSFWCALDGICVEWQSNGSSMLYYSMCLCICIKMWCSSNSNGNGNRKLMTNWFYGGKFLFAIVI